MFNLYDEQTAIQTSMMDIDDADEVTITQTENRDGLSLKKVEMVLPHFNLLVKI